MSRVDDLLAKAESGSAESGGLDVALAGELVSLKFYAMPGEEWAELTAANPLRPGVLVDANYGYNLHAVVKAAAVTHGRVIDGEAEETRDAEWWARVFKVISGHDMQALTDVVWGLNEYAPAQRVEELKKASRRGSGKKRG